MQKLLYCFLTILLLLTCSQCTKEVKIDIPGFEEELVVNGYIETNGLPIVILSKSQNIYAATNLQSYLASFVYDATVSVSNGSYVTNLELKQMADLSDEALKKVAEMLKVELDEALFLPIKVYTTEDFNSRGELGKTYTLTIQYQGKEFTGNTRLLNPVALANLYWKEDSDSPGYGRCVALLSDPVNEYNAYKWEAKRINKLPNGKDWDLIFRSGSSPYFDDQFWNGLTFEFDTRYPHRDTTQPSGLQRHYKFGDTVVIKMSRVEQDVFEFFDKKESQLQTNGNPFAAPVNIPSNLSKGCLGVWAGISPWYDTLICAP